MPIETVTLTTTDVVARDEGWLYESPLWDHRRDLFVWVDIEAGHVHTFVPHSRRRERYDLGQPVACIALRASGGYVVALERSIASLTDGFAYAEEVVAAPDLDDDVRFNDGAVAPDGAFWVGTLSHDRAGAGSLYRIGADHDLGTVISGVSISNGMDWSLNGKDHFYVDSGAGTVDVLHPTIDARTGVWSVEDRSTVFDLSPGPASPDGLAVDSQGDIWVALWGGSRVLQLSPTGTVRSEIVVPAPHVTSMSFGGADLATCTSPRPVKTPTQRQVAEFPLSGSVFRWRAEVAGRPAREWVG